MYRVASPSLAGYALRYRPTRLSLRAPAKAIVSVAAPVGSGCAKCSVTVSSSRHVETVGTSSAASPSHTYHSSACASVPLPPAPLSYQLHSAKVRLQRMQFNRRSAANVNVNRNLSAENTLDNVDAQFKIVAQRPNVSWEQFSRHSKKLRRLKEKKNAKSLKMNNNYNQKLLEIIKNQNSFHFAMSHYNFKKASPSTPQPSSSCGAPANLLLRLYSSRRSPLCRQRTNLSTSC